MIVLSNSLVLSEVDPVPLGTPWIGWHNIVTISNIVADTEDDDFPATNLANPATHLYWKGGVNTGTERLTVTTNYVGDIDYLAIAKHNLGSANITVSVEGKIDDGNSPAEPYLELVQEQMPPDDSPLIFRFPPQPLSHISLPLQQGDEIPQIGVMYVGKLLVLERGIKVDADHVPIKYGRRSTIVNGMSESGNFLGRTVLKQYRESTAQFSHYTPDGYRTNVDPFISASKNTPFFYAWNPITYPLECGYGWMINDPQPDTSPITGRVAFDLQMRGVA